MNNKLILSNTAGTIIISVWLVILFTFMSELLSPYPLVITILGVTECILSLILLIQAIIRYKKPTDN